MNIDDKPNTTLKEGGFDPIRGTEDREKRKGKYAFRNYPLSGNGHFLVVRLSAEPMKRGTIFSH